MTEPNRKPCVTHRLGERGQTAHAIVFELNPSTGRGTKEERPEEFGVRSLEVLKTSHESD